MFVGDTVFHAIMSWETATMPQAVHIVSAVTESKTKQESPALHKLFTHVIRGHGGNGSRFLFAKVALTLAIFAAKVASGKVDSDNEGELVEESVKQAIDLAKTVEYAVKTKGEMG